MKWNQKHKNCMTKMRRIIYLQTRTNGCFCPQCCARMCPRPSKQRAVLNEIRHCVFFSISPVCASIPDLKSDAVPTSVCMTIFGPRSVAVSPTEPCPEFARPKEQQPLQFSNTNGKFTAFSFVWEAAMCQHAALSVKVTFCVCVFDFLASLLFEALKPKSKL